MHWNWLKLFIKSLSFKRFEGTGFFATIEAMKIALVFMPAWLPYAPPLGIAALKGYLQEKGHEVTTLDYNIKGWDMFKMTHSKFWSMEEADYWQNFKLYNEHIKPFISPLIQDFTKEILQSNYDAIGFSVYSTNIHITRTVIAILRKMNPSMKIFIGGAQVNKDDAKFDFENLNIDAAIIGEGEESVEELLDFFQGTYTKKFIPGVILREEDGSLTLGPERPLLKMKNLPSPDFSDFDFSKYTGQNIPIEFSRGCIASCTFCSETNFWVSFRTKTALQIVDEMELHVKNHGISDFRIVDSLMNGNHRLLESMVDLILERSLVVGWNGFCRIDKKLTPELLRKMKKAGCHTVNYGIESGSQNVLNLMKKQYTVKEIYRCVKDTYEAGIHVDSQILIGFPGESWFNFFETLKTLRDLNPYFHRIYPGIPLEVTKQTEIWDNLDFYGVKFANNGRWYTKNFLNNYWIRKFRHYLLRSFLKILGVTQGYPLTNQNEIARA